MFHYIQMDIFTDVLNLLNKLENSLKCPICDEKCVQPVRIKTCGHYFCSECLKSSKEDHHCPKCNEFFELRHLDYQNIAKTTEKQLAELRKLLESTPRTNVSKENKTSEGLNTPKTVELSKENTIKYNDNSYHVNFISTVSKTNAKGETPLHLACKRSKIDEVKRLIESKVDINAKDYAGWAPLHEAVQSQSIAIIEYLLQENCLINIPGAECVTPLHQAASLNDADMVRLLLKYGADKNIVDYSGLKPEDSTKNESVKEVLKSYSTAILGAKTFEVFLPGKVSLYCHSIDDHTKKRLEDSKSIQVVDKMDLKKNLTHFMVKKTHKMSFKILQAMLEGLQFLTEESVENYIKGEYFIDIPEHVFLTNNTDLNKGIRKAMLCALLKFPKLFEGVNFYIEDHVKPINVYHLKVDKDYLSRLIKAGGGRVLHRPPATRTCESEYGHPFFARLGSGTYRCCNYIIFAENNAPDLLYNMSELQHKSTKWLIDCVVRYEICD